MTYKQLLEMLSQLSNEQLSQDVTFYDSQNDEFMPVSDKLGVATAENCDILDPDHVYLIGGQ